MLQNRVEQVEALSRVVRARRIHYEVLPELVFVGDERRHVGYQLTLWAAHEKGAGALPGCRACHELLQELTRLAAWLVAGQDREARWEVQPFDWALHESAQFPATDEIELSLTLLHRDREDAPTDAHQEQSLLEVRRRLAGLGICEGAWRPASSARRQGFPTPLLVHS